MKRDLLLSNDAPAEPNADAAGIQFPLLESWLSKSVPQLGRCAHAWCYPLTLLASLFWVYLPALSRPYLFLDDYVQLYGTEPELTTVGMFVSQGRPFAAAYVMICRSFTHRPDGIMLCHLLGVLGILFLGSASYIWLRRNAVARPDAALLSFLVATLPSVQMYGVWITAGSFSYGAASAVLALWMFNPGIQTEAEAWPRVASWPRVAGALVLLVAAQMTYQPTAMYFWSMAAAGMLISQTLTRGQAVRRGLAYLVLGCASVGLYAAIIKTFIYFGGWEASGRTRLVSPADVPAKLHWFLTEPLLNALSLWKLWPSTLLSLTVAGMIIAGLAVKWRLMGRSEDRQRDETEKSRRRWTLAAVAIIALTIPLSYLYNLLAAESWAAYRTTFAPTALMLVLAYVAIDALLVAAGRNARVPLRRSLLVGCALCGVISTHTNIYQRIVYPQVMEFQFLRRQLRKSDVAAKTAIYMIRPEWYEGVCREVRYDEFGLPSSYSESVPVPMVRRALLEMDLNPDHYVIGMGAASDPVPTKGDVIIVDMRQLAHLQGGASRR